MPCWYILWADDMSTETLHFFGSRFFSHFAVQRISSWSFGFATCKRTERWTMRGFMDWSPQHHFLPPCPASCGRNIFDNICMLSCFTLYIYIIEFCHWYLSFITILLSWRWLVSFFETVPRNIRVRIFTEIHRGILGYSQLLTPRNAINIDLMQQNKHLQSS